MTTLELVSHHLCPYVQRVAIVLAENGAAFERTYIDLDAKPAWFSEISPLGKVPVLRVDDQHILFESAAICEYLDETIGPRLHSDDALQRAHDRSWMEFGSAILSDLYGLETASDEPVYEAKRKALVAKFARVEAALTDGPWSSGERFGMVDAVFAPIFRYFDVFDELADMAVFATTPKTRMWRHRLAERPSVRGAVAPDYAERLHAFLVKNDAYLLTHSAPPSAEPSPPR